MGDNSFKMCRQTQFRTYANNDERPMFGVYEPCYHSSWILKINHYDISLSGEAAQLLLEKGIVGLGIDTLSPDRADSGYPVHAALLGAGKYIVENVANSGTLPPVGSFAFVLPIKIKEGTEAPIRLIALIPEALEG